MDSKLNPYLEERLPAFFRNYGIPDTVINTVVNDIRTRIFSLLHHWNDLEFRRTILSIGKEEATFYEPPVEMEVRCFVVVAIRNSLFENLVSTRKAARELGLETSPIPEGDVKKFTQEAMEYFKSQYFEELRNLIPQNFNEDVYRDLPNKYPVAWKALSYLGKWSNKAQIYDSLPLPPIDIPELDKLKSSSDENLKVVTQSGIDPTFDKGSLEILKLISQGRHQLFYSDSFKMVTRNIDKLMKIIEFVLRKECVFMTSNFFLSNGYVTKRKHLLRPAHTTEDATDNLNNFKGLHKTHLQVLKLASKNLLP